jgi:serine protease Do
MLPVTTPRRLSVCLLSAGAAAVALAAVLAGRAQQPNLNAVRKGEAERIAAIEKVRPAVVAIFAPGGQGGGSGVIISPDGYALTNWHVVDKIPPTHIRCGLPDGQFYYAVLVGLDKVGDVALIKILPNRDGQQFPTAPLGDSDTVREGDWSLAMGNPFLLATDFTPTVTFGMVSGVHRYQYPAGTLLEYTDCIQIDTSVNPGNSGGPLFNMKGELIGINGRISADKRGRLNSGVGYAISINQIKNFMGHLKAGIETDHASLGAVVKTESDRSGLTKAMVYQLLEDSDVARRGLDIDDEVLGIDGRRVASANQVKNVLGLYPRGWRVPVEFRREAPRVEGKEDIAGRKEILVRLMGIQKKLIGGDQPQPKVKVGPAPVGPSPAAKYFIAKAGFTNYYFNQQARDQLLEAFRKQGDFTSFTGNWTIKGKVTFSKANTASRTTLEITTVKSKEGRVSPLVRMTVEGNKLPYELQPLRPQQKSEELRAPKNTGFLGAMFVYHQLMTQGVKGFERCTHGGHEPVYPPRVDRSRPNSLKELREEAEVINTHAVPYVAKWFFSQKDKRLRAVEVIVEEGEDPCEVYFSDYRAVDGRQLPHLLQVYHADTLYGTFELTSFETSAKK